VLLGAIRHAVTVELPGQARCEDHAPHRCRDPPNAGPRPTRPRAFSAQQMLENRRHAAALNDHGERLLFPCGIVRQHRLSYANNRGAEIQDHRVAGITGCSARVESEFVCRPHVTGGFSGQYAKVVP